eukprot:m.109986 g.109986  ORF g.109986 m.109986 type:complete len:145 (+) comp21295_c1_seq4:2714-3148(+)
MKRKNLIARVPLTDTSVGGEICTLALSQSGSRTAAPAESSSIGGTDAMRVVQVGRVERVCLPVPTDRDSQLHAESSCDCNVRITPTHSLTHDPVVHARVAVDDRPPYVAWVVGEWQPPVAMLISMSMSMVVVVVGGTTGQWWWI